MQSLPLLGSTVAEKYRIEHLLGEGGMGAVFQAYHELIDKRVALKWLHPAHSREAESQKRLLREARASARIHHPNVCEVYDVGVHDGALFIVMELLEGESFEDLLLRGGLSVAEALRILLGAMRGAAEAHRCGIIHRDLKLDNIFVVRGPGETGEVIAKVLDFGVSKLIEDRQQSALVTQTGHTMGTPMYMSVEQMHAVRDIDQRTDVYALGVCLYRALTGTFPFAGETFAAVAMQMATHRPKSPRQLHPDLPAALDRIVMKAMAYDRANRYPTMQALIDALAPLLATTSTLASIPCRVVATPTQGSRAEIAAAPSGEPALFEVRPHVLRASTGGSTRQMRTRAQRLLGRRVLPVVLIAGLGLVGAWITRSFTDQADKTPAASATKAEKPAKQAGWPATEPRTQESTARMPSPLAQPALSLPTTAPSAVPEQRAPSQLAPPPTVADATAPPAVAPSASAAKPVPVQPSADAAVAKPAPAAAKAWTTPKRESAPPSRTATDRRSGTLRLEDLTQ